MSTNADELLKQFAQQFHLEYRPAKNEQPFGSLRFDSSKSFEALSYIKNLASHEVIAYNEGEENRYLVLNVTNVDTEKLSEILAGESKRRSNLTALVDEHFSDGHGLSQLLYEIAPGGGNWVFNGVTIQASIPSAPGFSTYKDDLPTLLDRNRKDASTTYAFLLVLKELEDRGAIKYHINEDTEVVITDADPALVRAASLEKDLLQKSLERFGRKSLGRSDSDKENYRS